MRRPFVGWRAMIFSGHAICCTAGSRTLTAPATQQISEGRSTVLRRIARCAMTRCTPSRDPNLLHRVGTLSPPHEALHRTTSDKVENTAVLRPRNQATCQEQLIVGCGRRLPSCQVFRCVSTVCSFCSPPHHDERPTKESRLEAIPGPCLLNRVLFN
jgi:hypothetical protein